MDDPQKCLGNSINYVHFQETRTNFESYSIDLVLAFSKGAAVTCVYMLPSLCFLK